MTAENFFINDGSNRQAIETVSECFPQFYVVTSFACMKQN